MDAIMKIAHRHNIKVIEDASHAHGSLYRGKLVGTIGDVSAYSFMSGKSFSCGEAGIMLTNDQRVYERAIAFDHYSRHADFLQLDDIKSGAGIPRGGYKYRMHQLSSAVGRLQLKYYPKRMAEIDKAMNYFWGLLQGIPGIRTHRPAKDSGSTMGGWYMPAGLYYSEELRNLSISRFCEAVRAEEATECCAKINPPLHLHPIFNDIDIYNQGKPTKIANCSSDIDVRQPPGSLPVSEAISEHVFAVPWFKHYRPKIIAEYADAFRKVAENHKELHAGDTGNSNTIGSWGLSVFKK